MADKFKPINGIKWFCQTTLPAIYDDTLTDAQIMARIKYGYNQMARQYNELPAYLQDLINQLVIDTTGDTGQITGAAWGYNEIPPTVPPVIREYQSFYLFKLPTGKTLMVDTGWHFEDQQVLDFFTEMGVDHLDYIYLTHFHEDHCGNFGFICTNIECTNATLFLPPYVDAVVAPDEYNNEQAVLAVAGNKQMDIIRPNVEGYTFSADANVTFSFYNVDHTSYYASDNFDYNNCSLCMQMQYKDNSFFFTGDVMEEAQAHLAVVAPKVTASDMAHHGSNTFINKDYFARLSPNFLVAENGRGAASISGNDNYLNRYSAENLLAQRHGIYVYPTSKGMTLAAGIYYVVPIVLNSHGVFFFTDALTMEREGKYNFAMGDATEQAAAHNTTLAVDDFTDEIEGNSRNVFVTPASGYAIRPKTNTNFAGLADIIKSNSASSLQSLASTDATKDVYRAIAWFYNGVGYDTILASLYRAAGQTTVKDAQNMSGRNFYQKTVAVNTAAGTNRYTFNTSETRYFGDNAEISAGGIKILKSGLYKISVAYIGSQVGDGESVYRFRFGKAEDASNIDERSEYGVCLSGIAPDGIHVHGYAENVVWLSANDMLYLDSLCDLSGSIRCRLELLSYSTNKTTADLFD